MSNIDDDDDSNILLVKKENVEIKINSPKSVEVKRNNSKSDSSLTSQDDLYRKELLWEKREETIFLKWLANCRTKSKKHENKSKICKIKYGMFSIPSITIPIIVSGLSSSISCDSMENSILMMITALFTCVNAFFNFGKRQEKHEQYSNKYFELANEIEAELSKPKRHRIACDVYMEKIKQKYNNLHATEPNL
jgi:sRNA-binding carbon storage regulator CsrA